MNNRIKIAIYGNEKMIGFHVNKKLYDGAEWRYQQTISTLEPPPAPEHVTVFLTKAISLLGVTEASVSHYEIRIERAEAFDWCEIVPQALELIAELAGFSDYELVIDDQRQPWEYDEDGMRSHRIQLKPVDLGVAASNPYAEPERVEPVEPGGQEAA